MPRIRKHQPKPKDPKHKKFAAKTTAGKERQKAALRKFHAEKNARATEMIARYKENMEYIPKHTYLAYRPDIKQCLALDPETAEITHSNLMNFSIEYDNPDDIPDGYIPLPFPDILTKQKAMGHEYGLLCGSTELQALRKSLSTLVFTSLEAI